MSYKNPQNPGWVIPDELTSSELALIQSLASLGDPNADRILFWDDSAGAYRFLTPGTGLTITNTTIDASGSGITIGTTTITSGTTTRVLYNNAGVVGEYVVSGSGNVAMTTNAVFTTPNLGTPSAVVLTNGTGLPIGGITGLGTGVGTALAVNVGSAGAFVTFNGALGTPSSGTVTNLTGTASININGTVGATTPAAGTFTTATANSFIPNLSTVPSNGMYLPAANTLGWAINSAAELQLTGTALSPAADGGSSLGTTALGWQNLFANTGFIINIENGNWVATHTTGILTVGTGDLRITTEGTNTASVVTVGGTQTLTGKTLTAPRIASAGFIADANGNEQIIFTTTASAVNEMTHTNAATGANPSITASGGDANVGLDFILKGTGTFNIRGNSTQAAELRIYEDTDDGTNFSALRGSARSTDITYIMPTTDPTAGQVLTASAPSSNVSTLSWGTASAGGGLNPTSVTYLEYPLNVLTYSTADVPVGWSISGFTAGTMAANQGAGGDTFFASVGTSDPVLSANLPGINANNTYRFSHIGANAMYLQFRCKLGTVGTGEIIGFGVTDSANGIFSAQTSAAESSIRFALAENSGDKLYAVVSDGSTNQNTDVTGAITLTNWNTYGITITSSLITFYINGTSVATFNTTLPTTTNSMLVAYGINNTGNAPTMRIGRGFIKIPTS